MGDQYIFNHFNSGQDFNSSTPNQQFIKQKIFTDAIIQDASYIALRNVNIGYTFSDDSITSQLKLGFEIFNELNPVTAEPSIIALLVAKRARKG